MKHILIITLLTLTLLITACQSAPAVTTTENAEWLSTPLTDIATNQQFTLDQFNTPILLESFAVWCPTCTKQQNIIKDLHEIVGDTVTSISLDTDPNEDTAIVQNHINQHGFDWYYAISPPELTQSLIDQFGINVVNAPRAPIVLICPDHSARLLKNGLKSVEELQQEIATC